MSEAAVGEAPGEPRWTRRHPWREFTGWCDRRWLDVTSVLRGPTGKISMLRVILATFVIRFTQKWPAPGEWTPDTVKVLAILVFALTVDTLMGRIPATEALGAVQAFFASITAKAVGKARNAYGAYRYQPPAPGEPPDDYIGAEGER